MDHREKTTQETYDRIAGEWDNDHSRDTWWYEGTDAFIGALPKAGLVLDVGCGTGVKAAYLLEQGLEVIGIDYSREMLKRAYARAPGAEFRFMDMHDVEMLPERFDGVFAQASLLHIPRSEAARVVKGFASVLKPGGCLYIAVKAVRLGGALEEMKTEDDYKESYVRFFSYYTMTDLHKYMQAAGLVLVADAAVHVGHTIWLQAIARKPRD